MNLEEAKKLIEEEQKKKIEEFLKEYKELCIKHGFEIVGNTVLSIVPVKR